MSTVPYIPKKILVTFTAEATKADIDGLLQRHGLKTVVRYDVGDRLCVVEVTAGQEDEMTAKLNSEGLVLQASRDFLLCPF